MFVGHFAVGFGAKRAAPAASLGTLFLACQFADLVWPNLVLLGIERVAIDPGNTAVTPLDFISYPYSHSLVALGLWGVLVAVAYHLMRRGPASAALTVGVVVVSHWVLDWIAHRADMPLTISGTTRVGLGLWNSVPGTVAVELSTLAVGLWLYVTTTRARDRIGRIALWSLVAFLLVVNAANMFGPPPPGPAAVAWAGQAIWLLVLWGYWIDRHREPV
ncbi:MAG: hypothetical protein ABJC51_07140, partial [Acidobacteriota bacterium]